MARSAEFLFFKNLAYKKLCMNSVQAEMFALAITGGITSCEAVEDCVEPNITIINNNITNINDEITNITENINNFTEEISFINNIINNFVEDVFDGTFLVHGGQMVWLQNYDYRVSPAYYFILGEDYNSDLTDITLAVADATFDRIDLVVADTSENIVVITGTPAADPQQPSWDASTQIPLAFILVTAATTQPPCAANTTVYQENLGTGGGEWNAVSSGGSMIVSSPNFPRTGSIDIEGTAVPANTTVTLTPASPVDFTDITQFDLYIRSKGTWFGNNNNVNNAKRIIVSFNYTLASVPFTQSFTIFANGSYGFDSSITGVYQQVAIPVFLPATSMVTSIVLRVAGPQGTIGFYIDDIQLEQNCIIVPPQPGLDTDEKVGVSSNDSTPGYLIDKLVAGAGITLVENNNGGNETLTITSTSALTFDNALTRTVDNVQWGGILLHNTTVADGGSNFGSTFQRTGSGTTMIVQNLGSGFGLYAEGLSISGALLAKNLAHGLGAQITTEGSITNTIVNSLQVGVTTTGTALNGLGAAIRFSIEASDGAGYEPSRIASTWTDVSQPTRTGDLQFWTTNLGGTAVKATIAGTGQWRFHPYGAGAFTTGTATYILATTSNGTVIEYPSGGLSGGLITADNGLTMSTATNVQWGGSLLQNTAIAATTFLTTFTSDNANTSVYALQVTNSTGGGSLGATNNGSGTTSSFGNSGIGDALLLNAVSGRGLVSNATTGKAARLLVNPSTNSTVVTIFEAARTTSSGSFGAVGMGGSFDFRLESDAGTERLSNQLISKWVDASDATRISQLLLTGINAAVTTNIMAVHGTGVVGIGKFSSFTGTRLEVVDDALAGASMAKFTSASTAATGNIQTGILVDISGANATNDQTSYGIRAINSHTGGGTVINVAIKGDISNGSSAGAAVWGQAAGSQYGVRGTTVSGVGGLFEASGSGTGFNASSVSGVGGSVDVNPSSTNTIVNILQLRRFSSGSPANGIGGDLSFLAETTSALSISASIASTWTDVTHATRTGDLQFWTTTSATPTLKMTIKGSGVINIATALGDHANNAAAITAGLVAGDIYRNGDILMIVH